MRRLIVILLLPLCSCTHSDSVRIATARMRVQEAWWRVCPPPEWMERPWIGDVHDCFCECTWCLDERMRDE